MLNFQTFQCLSCIQTLIFHAVINVCAFYIGKIEPRSQLIYNMPCIDKANCWKTVKYKKIDRIFNLSDGSNF